MKSAEIDVIRLVHIMRDMVFMMWVGFLLIAVNMVCFVIGCFSSETALYALVIMYSIIAPVFTVRIFKAIKRTG